MGFTANTAFVVLAGCAGALLSALLLGASFLLFRRRQGRSRRALWEQAYVDPVTGGPTRLRFERDAEALASAAAPGSYAVVDINLYHFRFMNNLFGRAEGDRILRHIYTTCSARLQPGELICHIAADDFRFLLHFSGQDSMVSRVQEMAEAANEFNNELTDHYYLWFKAGVSVVDGTADTFASYLDYAKIACKENGPGRPACRCTCTFYEPRQREQALREQTIFNNMAAALEQGEFQVYLQPKVNCFTGRIVGAEALTRWVDPEKGLVMPAEFIPVLEHSGFITKLDLYVFGQVCATLRGWLDAGLEPVPISINFSRASLWQPHVMEQYDRLRRKYAVPGKYLEIELTETFLADGEGAFVALVDEIHALGMRCAIDDFGSGYSALNLLRRVKVDTLKLDRSFFPRTAPERERKRALTLVRHIVALGRDLGTHIVAEGVEERSQVEFLQGLGLHTIQGFYYYRPLPLDRFEAVAFQKGQAIFS